MRAGGDVYRFGPFELDSAGRRLLRGREPVALPDRHAALLLLLVSNAGVFFKKDAIIERVWGNAVADHTLERAVWNLRKTLGLQSDAAPGIETRPRVGYRYVGPVDRATPRIVLSDAALDARFAPHHAFVKGRAAVESLDADAIALARDFFGAVLLAAPDDVAAHIGMANACVLTFESTRADVLPDMAALQQAEHHAREARRLDPSSGEAWATLAFVLSRTGNDTDAIAAAREAIALEPGIWQHQLRLACVSWGDTCIRAAQRVLKSYPELALAHWFAARVFVARQDIDAAMAHARAGCARQDAQQKDRPRFHAVGLHLLHGLLLLSRGEDDQALDEFAREIAACQERHVYALECAANTWYACGALHLRRGRHAEAETAFRTALTLVPEHPYASAAMAALASPASSSGLRSSGPLRRPVPSLRADMESVDGAVSRAIVLALAGDHEEAARGCGDALANAQGSAAAWLLPIEPLLNVTAHRDAWAPALAMLRQSAL